MSYSVQDMRRDGIRPSDWDWYRLPPPEGPRHSGVVLAPQEPRAPGARGAWWGAVISVVAFLLILPAALASPNAITVTAAVASTCWLIRRLIRLGRLPERRAPAPDEATQMVFGAPGGVAAAVDVFGQDAVAAGVEGESRTAELLDLLVEHLPGTSVFHGLQFPGAPRADVDHAVANGNHVFLIDSKMYRWGEYRWRSNEGRDEIVRSDGYGRPKANWMHAATAEYEDILGDNVSVTAIVLIHGRNVKVVGPSVSEHGVFLMTADEAMECIGDRIRTHLLAGWPDSPRVRHLLQSNLKQAAA